MEASGRGSLHGHWELWGVAMPVWAAMQAFADLPPHEQVAKLRALVSQCINFFQRTYHSSVQHLPYIHGSDQPRKDLLPITQSGEADDGDSRLCAELKSPAHRCIRTRRMGASMRCMRARSGKANTVSSFLTLVTAAVPSFVAPGLGLTFWLTNAAWHPALSRLDMARSRRKLATTRSARNRRARRPRTGKSSGTGSVRRRKGRPIRVPFSGRGKI